MQPFFRVGKEKTMADHTDKFDESQRRKLQEYIFGLEEIQEKAESLAAEHKQLTNTQALLTAILRATMHGICIVRDGKIAWFNNAVIDITGWGQDDLAGKDMDVLFSEKGQWCRNQLETNKAMDTEMKIACKSGETKTCLISGRPLDENRMEDGCLFSIADISDAKKAEEALRIVNEELENRVAERTAELDLAKKRLEMELEERKKAERARFESEARYRAVLEAHPDPVVVYDLKGRVVYFNPAFEWVFGWSLKERRGKRMDIFVPEECWVETQKMIEKNMDGVSFSNIETQRYNKDGAKIPVSISASIFRDSEGKPEGTMATLRDISEQKRLEKQLHQAQKLESIGTLAGGVAHDFNNLLMGIQGYASILMETDLTESQKEKLKKIENFVQSGASLTKQILGFAKGGKYDVKSLSLNEVVYKTADMFGRTRKQIGIHHDYQPDLWAVKADRSQLEQVLLNICVNAWQAMPEGGNIHLKTRNETLAESNVKPFEVPAGHYVKLSVTDTGIGMDEATLPRIFDPFFTTKEVGRGTGLGLASAYGIVRNHGGFITVYSEPGVGSTFNVYLPASDEEVVEMQVFYESLSKGTETILLVDDEELVLEVAQELLNDLGYKVFVARSGGEAVRIYEKKRDQIDLVILDMIMPGLSGWGTFERLKAIDKNVKVLLSSGYSISNQASELLDKGCVGFLAKPFGMKSLSRKLREILEGK